MAVENVRDNSSKNDARTAVVVPIFPPLVAVMDVETVDEKADAPRTPNNDDRAAPCVARLVDRRSTNLPAGNKPRIIVETIVVFIIQIYPSSGTG
jgi:hypothetical protein